MRVRSKGAEKSAFHIKIMNETAYYMKWIPRKITYRNLFHVKLFKRFNIMKNCVFIILFICNWIAIQRKLRNRIWKWKTGDVLEPQREIEWIKRRLKKKKLEAFANDLFRIGVFNGQDSYLQQNYLNLHFLLQDSVTK